MRFSRASTSPAKAISSSCALLPTMLCSPRPLQPSPRTDTARMNSAIPCCSIGNRCFYRANRTGPRFSKRSLYSRRGYDVGKIDGVPGARRARKSELCCSGPRVGICEGFAAAIAAAKVVKGTGFGHCGIRRQDPEMTQPRPPVPSPAMSSVDGSRIARGNSLFWRIGRVQSSVRPVHAAVRSCWP